MKMATMDNVIVLMNPTLLIAAAKKRTYLAFG
jgi:hypothetical protein